MALYEVDAPNGMTYRVEAPDGTPPEQVSDYFRISLYPDILRADKPEEKPEPQQSFLRQVADVPLQIGKGAVSGIRMIADAFGPGSPASESLKGAETYIEGLLSAQSRKDSAEIARIMEDAKDKGVYDQVVGAVQALGVAPVDLVAQGLGTMAPAIIATLATGPAAAIPIGGAVGAAMGAGGIKGAIFEETKKEFMGRGVSESVATGLAQEAAAYEGKNLDQILIGAGLGATDALTGANRILGNAARRAAGRAAAEETTEVGRGLAARTALGVAGEAPLEALQGGQEQLARNLAIQREEFERPTFQGVAGSAALEGLTGGVIGGASRAAFGRRPDVIPPVVPPVSPGVEMLPPAAPPATPGLTPPSPPGAPPGAAAAAGALQTPGSLQNIYMVSQPGAAVATPGPLQRPAGTPSPYVLSQGVPTRIEIPPTPLGPVPPTPGAAVAPPSVPAPGAAAVEPPAQLPLEPVNVPPTPALGPLKATLPRYLAGAKPKFSAVNLQFTNDVDKALYITAQSSKSKMDEDYRAWLQGLGYANTDINRLGTEVRKRIKGLVSKAPGAKIVQVPAFTPAPTRVARTTPLPGRVTPVTAPVTAQAFSPRVPTTIATALGARYGMEPAPVVAAPAPSTTDLGSASARTPEPLRVRSVKTNVPSVPEIEVAPQIVELSDVISSEVPGYDQTLQPRDRTRPGSDVQISNIISTFDPQLLIFDQSTKRGAPIVNDNLNVESGNGRIMALRRIYNSFPGLAQSYKDELARQGFNISGMTNPVLVQRRTTQLTPDQTQEYISESNSPDVLLMSPSEQAEQDAKRITVEMLDRIPEGRDYTHPAFVLEFLRTIPVNELGSLIDKKDGNLNSAGIARVRNAVFAKAFGDSQAVARISESTDDNIKSISNALIDNVAAFAKLKVSVDEGRTDKGFSAEPLIDAINRISQMRNTGTTLENYISQIDAFNPLPPMTEKFMRLFYSEKARALGRAKISDGLKFYAGEALKVTPVEGGLGLGLPQTTPIQLIDAAIKRAQGVVEGQGALALEPVAKQPADPAVVTPAVSPMAVTVANRKRISSSDLGDVLRPTTRVTFSDGTATDIQRLNAAEADGVPGWHDRSKNGDFYVSYLGDTEKNAIAELLKRKNAEKFIPSVAPVGVVAATQPTDLGPSNQPVIVGEVPQSVKDSTKMDISPGVSKWFDENLPGVDKVLRELQYRLYPGTEFSIDLIPGPRSADEGSFGRMIPARMGQGVVEIEVNPERLKGYFGSARGDYRTKLLHTLLHEMSHPIQHFWINNADADTQVAIFAQFNKERSSTAIQRAGLYQYVLEQGNPALNTEDFRKRLLDSFDLTEEQFNRVIKTRTDIPSSRRDTYRSGLSSTYVRNYSEWVAEKGAQWMSKELQGRLPQTVFERFQKDIFVRLRSIYETVAKLLGVPTSTGAFEKMLSDIWGVKVSTPEGKFGVAEGKPNLDTVLSKEDIRAYDEAVGGNPSALGKLPGGDTARLNSEKFAKLTTKVREFFDPTYMVDKYPILSEFRNLLFGKIGMSTQRARDLSNTISKGTPEVQAQSYTFLTTRDADPNIITDENVRKASIEVKKEINRTAQEMVDKGFLSQESLDKYYDQYLPRMYLYYEATGAGVKSPNRAISEQGYLDFRKELTPEDRELLGEIKNPAFLSYVALTRPQNDLAVAEYFEQIKAQTGVEWIAPNSLVEFQGDMVTPFWLAAEANKMSAIADLTQNTDPVAAERMRNRADEMRRTAGPETERQKIIDLPDNYRRLPDSPRYGVLRGAVIQKGIYDDIVGGIVSISVSDKPWVQALLGDEQSVVVKANQLWKMSKITLNIPSQVRNAISNMLAMNVFGGVPLYRIAPLLARATREISTNGKYWEEAQKYGITGGTMSAAEMIRVRTELEQYLRKGGGKDIFGAFGAARIAAGKAIGVASDTYQAVEVRFKMALFIHGREKGLSPSAAVDAANESLFDYTLVNPNIRYLRNAPLGLPFVTYYYKALPKLVETAYKHPTRFAPYVALALALPQLTMLALDIDDDDYESLRKSLPEYVRNKGSLFILPYKDESGRWQYIDTAPFFPWAAFSDPIVQATLRGDPGGGLKEAGKLIIPSGPIVTVIAGIATGRDPFTGREIIDPRQTPQNKALALVSYVWNQAMPSMLSIDAVNPQNASGAIPRLYNDAFGSGTGLDKRGQPKPEFLASAARLFGANINSLEPVNQRALNINFMLNKIRASESLRAQVAKDQSLTPVARQREVSALNEKIREDYKKLQEYATETARAASLKK